MEVSFYVWVVETNYSLSVVIKKKSPQSSILSAEFKWELSRFSSKWSEIKKKNRVWQYTSFQ